MKPSAMAPSLKTHFLEAHRCSIPSTPSPHLFAGIYLPMCRVPPSFFPFSRFRSWFFSRFRGPPSVLPALIGVSSTDRIHPYFGTYDVTEFAHPLASAPGLRNFRFHVFLVTSPPVGLAPVSASCFESSVVSGLVCCLPLPRPSVGVRPFGFHRSESS